MNLVVAAYGLTLTAIVGGGLFFSKRVASPESKYFLRGVATVVPFLTLLTVFLAPSAALISHLGLQDDYPLTSYGVLQKMRASLAFLIPLVGTGVSFSSRSQAPAQERWLFMLAGIGYILLLAFAIFVASLPPWGPT
jgi:hypothetical protein